MYFANALKIRVLMTRLILENFWALLQGIYTLSREETRSDFILSSSKKSSTQKKWEESDPLKSKLFPIRVDPLSETASCARKETGTFNTNFVSIVKNGGKLSRLSSSLKSKRKK